MITVLIYVAVMFTWIFALFDLFARSDLSGWLKALWLLVIIFLPILGVVVYFVLRPAHVQWWTPADPFASDAYSRSTRSLEIGEVETLVRLRSEGVITEEEFTRMKERVISGGPQLAGGAPTSTP
jgi:hypothetical protein